MAPVPDELLQVKLYNFDKDTSEAFRAPLTNWILQKLGDMHTLNIQRVAQFIEIVEHDSGSATPAEEFITGLVTLYAYHGLTPNDAECSLENFRDNFDVAIKVAKWMQLKYPSLLAQ